MHDLERFCVTRSFKENWSTGKSVDLYSINFRFGYLQGHHLFWVFFCGFPPSVHANNTCIGPQPVPSKSFGIQRTLFRTTKVLTLLSLEQSPFWGMTSCFLQYERCQINFLSYIFVLLNTCSFTLFFPAWKLQATETPTVIRIALCFVVRRPLMQLQLRTVFVVGKFVYSYVDVSTTRVQDKIVK